MRYPDTTRARAVELYLQHGTAKTSDTLGIPRRTIIRWAKAAGAVSRAKAKQTEEATRWHQFREGEADAAGQEASHLREQLHKAAEHYQLGASSIRALAIAYGILVDKAELLTGRATSRVETVSEQELDAEITKLMEEQTELVHSEG